MLPKAFLHCWTFWPCFHPGKWTCWDLKITWKGKGTSFEPNLNFGLKMLSSIHPWRLTWNIIMEVWKIIFLSKWVICMFHVNLPGCNFPGYVFLCFFRRMGLGFFLVVSVLFCKARGIRVVLGRVTGPNTTTLVNRWRFGDMTWHSWHWIHVSNP